MAGPSPLPTARPNPFIVARRIVQRQASSATCGWISGDISKPITCPGQESCLYDTTSLNIAYCCDALAGCNTPTTACLDSSSASSQCEQESCGPSTLQCTNSDLPFCQTLYYPFSNTLSSFACVSSLTSSFTAYDVYTTTTSEGSSPNGAAATSNVQPGSGRESGATASSTTTSPFLNTTPSSGPSSSPPTSQSPTSSPPISTSTSPTSQSPTSTSTALSSSTPHPLPTSVSPFPTSTFDSINRIAGASLFFLIVISFLLTLILWLNTRHERPRPSTAGGDTIYCGGGSSYPPTRDTSNGSTASTLAVSGPGPDPPPPPPPGSYTNSNSDTPSAPSSQTTTIRRPTPTPSPSLSSTAPPSHSSGPPPAPAISPTPGGPNPLQDPKLPGHEHGGDLTSQPSTGTMSNSSAPQQLAPPGLVPLADLQLNNTRSKPLPEEPS